MRATSNYSDWVGRIAMNNEAPCDCLLPSVRQVYEGFRDTRREKLSFSTSAYLRVASG